MPGGLICVETRVVVFLLTHVCLLVIEKAGKEDLEVLTRNGGIG